MASVNKVIILGRVGQDPETRTLPSGEAVCNISVATDEKWKAKDGSPMSETTWHRVSFFGRLAEIAGEYLRKGSPVYVEGSIRHRKFTDKEGAERTSTEIKGHSMQLLGSRQDGDQGGGQRGNERSGYGDRGQGQSQQRGTPAQRGGNDRGGYQDRGAPQRQQPAQRSRPADDFDDGGDIPF